MSDDKSSSNETSIWILIRGTGWIPTKMTPELKAWLDVTKNQTSDHDGQMIWLTIESHDNVRREDQRIRVRTSAIDAIKVKSR